jgi:hypothetical protein
VRHREPAADDPESTGARNVHDVDNSAASRSHTENSSVGLASPDDALIAEQELRHAPAEVSHDLVGERDGFAANQGPLERDRIDGDAAGIGS